MSAMPDNIVPFSLPKKPRIREKEAPPDQRKIAVIPIRACTDKQLTHGMLKALILICSYMNRSGITWVSQKTLAEKLGISQQAISKQLVKLTKLGYLEILRRPIPGERHTTWRVIFDPTISAEDAVAITSSIEDTRPPYMQNRDNQAMQDTTPDPEGQRRIASLIAKALKPTVTKKEYSMPKTGTTRTVQKMQEDIAKAKSKRAQAQPLEVVQPSELQAQPLEPSGTTSEGCTEHKNTGIYKDNVLHNQSRVELRKAGLSDAEIDENLGHLLDAYQAEGLTPDPERLPTEILAMHRGVA